MTPLLFLTGASGMVGTNILNHCSAKNWNVIAPSSKELDLMDYSAVTSFYENNKPNMVVHCAGKVGGISANLMEPVAFLDKNIVIGRNVIMGARTAGVKKLLNLASTCIYPREAVNPLKENLILEGRLEPTNEGYALAKIVALRLCQYISREDPSFNYKTLIPCNLYGHFDKFDPLNSHLLPAIIHKLHQAKSSKELFVEIWGNGSARREFMFVEDLVEAIFLAMEQILDIPDIMNLGVGNDHSIKKYYQTVASVLDWPGSFTYNTTKPTGMVQKLSDISAQTKWGWQPKTSLEDGIKSTYKYYLEHILK
tara:strand:- start:92 stop:1021 length:930 start_codon:yes stop_codon:yes gene_type:complete